MSVVRQLGHGLVPWLLILGCRAAAPGGASVAGDGVVLERGVAWGLASAQTSTVGFAMSCHQADTLVEVSSPDGHAMLHDSGPHGMGHVTGIPCAPGRNVVLRGGGHHVMLTEITHGLTATDSVRIDLRWSQGTQLRFAVPVLRYSEAQDVLAH